MNVLHNRNFISGVSATCIFATLGLLVITSYADHNREVVKAPEHPKKYNLVAITEFGNELDDAVNLVNTLLDGEVGFKLYLALRNAPNNVEAIPVYRVLVEPKGKYGISFIPKYDRCIFIDSGVIPDISMLLANGFTGGLEIPTTELIAIALLHESGHLVQGTQPIFKSEVMAIPSPYSPQENKNKPLELDADRFAARLIRENSRPSLNSRKFLAANDLKIALSKISFNLTGSRVFRHSTESVLGCASLFGDSDDRHPNWILRVLIMNHEISNTRESKALLDEFMDKRGQATNCEKLFSK